MNPYKVAESWLHTEKLIVTTNIPKKLYRVITISDIYKIPLLMLFFIRSK